MVDKTKLTNGADTVHSLRDKVAELQREVKKWRVWSGHNDIERLEKALVREEVRAQKAEAEIERLRGLDASHERSRGLQLQSERDKALARVAELEERLQFDPGGSDKIDELEMAVQFLRFRADKAVARLEAVREWADRESFATPRLANSDEYLEAKYQIRAILDDEGGRG